MKDTGRTVILGVDRGSRVVSDILARADRLGFGPEDVFALRLGLDEAIQNAHVHGNQSDGRKRIRIAWEVAPDATTVVVEDEGSGFDPSVVADPTGSENLMRSGGRGLFLMRAYLHDVAYNNRGNTVRLTRYRTDPSGARPS